MKELPKADQEILRFLSEGLTDHEICLRKQISLKALERAIKRIEARAAQESDDAGRYYERALKTRAQKLNIALSARLRALMDTIPQAVLVIDGRTGEIREFNALACKLFGYSKAELARLTVEDLVQVSSRSIHPSYRFGFLANVRKRAMGYHPPILGVCRDGTEVEMAIALTATPADDDVMVICTELSRWTDGNSSDKPTRLVHQ